MRSASRQWNDVVEKILFPSPHHNVVRREYPYRTTLSGRGDHPCDQGRYGCLAETDIVRQEQSSPRRLAETAVKAREYVGCGDKLPPCALWRQWPSCSLRRQWRSD